MNYYGKKTVTDIAYFIARSLGPDYQIVLYIVEDNRISGIECIQNLIDSAYIEACKEYLNRIIKERNLNNSSFLFHYYGRIEDSRSIRSSSYFINDENGVLCAILNIDFDQKRYQALSKEIYRLCHPDSFIESEPFLTANSSKHNDISFNTVSGGSAYTRESLSSVISDILNLDQGHSIADLSVKERRYLIAELDKRGIFKIKGAVKEVADILGCSPSTIYRSIQE